VLVAPLSRRQRYGHHHDRDDDGSGDLGVVMRLPVSGSSKAGTVANLIKVGTILEAGSAEARSMTRCGIQKLCTNSLRPIKCQGGHGRD
jgi:hypothetical protein